jgi:hypothetical protein
MPSHLDLQPNRQSNIIPIIQLSMKIKFIDDKSNTLIYIYIFPSFWLYMQNYNTSYWPFQHFQCKGICCSHPHNVHDQLQLLVPSLSTLKRANASGQARLHGEEIPIAYLVWGDADSRDPPKLTTWVSFMYTFNVKRNAKNKKIKIKIKIKIKNILRLNKPLQLYSGLYSS